MLVGLFLLANGRGICAVSRDQPDRKERERWMYGKWGGKEEMNEGRDTTECYNQGKEETTLTIRNF